MKFKKYLELEHGLRQIDIAPLIDMVFLLLIFFMLTSSFLTQPGISVSLPKAITSEVVNYENIELVVSGENVVYLDGKIITIPELKALLKQVAARNQPILIKSDRKASLGRVVEIWDICRDSGITRINIATNRE